jgi:hypothetical protein
MQIIIKINNDQVLSMNCNDFLALQTNHINKTNDSLTNCINPFVDLFYAKNWKWAHQSSQLLKGKPVAQNTTPSIKQNILFW